MSENTRLRSVTSSRGSKQSNLRAHNERLLLSLVRHTQGLAKADIARLTGLSPQTISVITGTLEKDGLLLRGDPIRGRVGQPSVPLRLNPDGAYSIGVSVGRRGTRVALMNFVGELVQELKTSYAYPLPTYVIEFVRSSIRSLTATLSEQQKSSIAGVGISTPFELYNWVGAVGAPLDHIAKWKSVDLLSEIESMTSLPTFLENDGTAACRAELVTGVGSRYSNYLYIYVGTFIGGGVVLNGSLYSGQSKNAGAIGSMPVYHPDSGTSQLIDSASIWLLEKELKKIGIEPDLIWARDQNWQAFGDTVNKWINSCGRSIASAIAAACSVIDFESVIVDGAFPDDIRSQIVGEITKQSTNVDFAGISPPTIVTGTIGTDARITGAATIPLSNRFLLDQNMLLAENTG